MRLRDYVLVVVAASPLFFALPREAAGAPFGRALSIGYPNGGKLAFGRRIRETSTLRIVPAYGKSPAKWAIPGMLELLDRASRKVAARFPGAVLGVGELSNQDGGPLASHRSHQNGRDADVGFYLQNGRGRALKPLKFVPCDGEGHSREITTTVFDEPRNWALVEALLSDSEVNVRQIFVYAPLRARLLSFAEKMGAPRPLRERAAIALMQPSNVAPHDDHFHVRIACPKGQYARGCIDDSRLRVLPRSPSPDSVEADEDVGEPEIRSGKGAARSPAEAGEPPDTVGE